MEMSLAGESETLSTGHKYGIRAEVGLLTRNIRIRSDSSDVQYGARVVVGYHRIARDGEDAINHRGSNYVQNINFDN